MVSFGGEKAAGRWCCLQRRRFGTRTAASGCMRLPSVCASSPPTPATRRTLQQSQEAVPEKAMPRPDRAMGKWKPWLSRSLFCGGGGGTAQQHCGAAVGCGCTRRYRKRAWCPGRAGPQRGVSARSRAQSQCSRRQARSGHPPCPGAPAGSGRRIRSSTQGWPRRQSPAAGEGARSVVGDGQGGGGCGVVGTEAAGAVAGAARMSACTPSHPAGAKQLELVRLPHGAALRPRARCQAVARTGCVCRRCAAAAGCPAAGCYSAQASPCSCGDATSLTSQEAADRSEHKQRIERAGWLKLSAQRPAGPLGVPARRPSYDQGSRTGPRTVPSRVGSASPTAPLPLLRERVDSKRRFVGRVKQPSSRAAEAASSSSKPPQPQHSRRRKGR